LEESAFTIYFQSAGRIEDFKAGQKCPKNHRGGLHRTQGFKRGILKIADAHFSLNLRKLANYRAKSV